MKSTDLGNKLHQWTCEQADEIVYGASYVEDCVGGCRVDSEIDFYALARQALEFLGIEDD